MVLAKGSRKIDLGNGIVIPLEECQDSDLECVKIQLQRQKDIHEKEKAYKLVSRKVNEVWDAVEGDRLDMNDLHQKNCG